MALPFPCDNFIQALVLGHHHMVMYYGDSLILPFTMCEFIEKHFHGSSSSTLKRSFPAWEESLLTLTLTEMVLASKDSSYLARRFGPGTCKVRGMQREVTHQRSCQVRRYSARVARAWRPSSSTSTATTSINQGISVEGAKGTGLRVGAWGTYHLEQAAAGPDRSLPGSSKRQSVGGEGIGLGRGGGAMACLNVWFVEEAQQQLFWSSRLSLLSSLQL